MRRTHRDIAFVASQIINAIRNRFAGSILRKVGCKNVQRFTPPRPASVSKSADQLFFLRIDADSGQTRLLKLAAEACEVAKLLVALYIVARTQAFAIAAERISLKF